MSDRWGRTLANNSQRKAEENRLRRVATRQGLVMSKVRRRDRRATDYGLWTLRTASGNQLLATKDLVEVAEYLEPQSAQQARPGSEEMRAYFDMRLREALAEYGMNEEQTEKMLAFVHEMAERFRPENHG